jgi:hypothetical protein
MRLLLPLVLLLASCTAVTVSDGNTEPTVEIVAPDDGDTFDEGDDVTFVGNVDDSGSPVGDLDVSWTSSQDGLLLEENPSSGTVSFTTDALGLGEHTVTLRAEDPAGLSAADAVGITIEEPLAQNTVPDCAITAPADDSEHDELDTLFLEGSATDVESLSTDLVATWASSEDGILGTATPSSSGDILLPVDDLTPGLHIITLDVEDPDGLNCSEFITLEILAANTAPTVDAPTVTPDPLFTDDTATCDVPTPVDAEGDAITVDVHWFVEGIDTGETTDTLAGTFFDKGDAVTCTATPSDPLTAGTPSTSADVIVSDSAPTAPIVSIAPAAPTAGLADLICSVDTPSDDADGDPITYAVTWTLNASPWTGTTSTTTLTDDTIPAASVVDGTWECSIVPTADSISGPAGTDTVAVGAANQPPSVGAPAITPDPLLTDTDAVCTPPTPTDPENDPVTLTFAWTVNSAPAGTNSDTLDSSNFAKDDVIVCEVTPSDAAGTGAPASESLTVDDTPPIAPIVDIDPASPSSGVDDLHCEVTTDSTDADNEAVSYTVEWLLDAAPYTGPTFTQIEPGDSIAAVDVVDGLWTCTVTPTADSIDGPPGSASATATTTIDNPPTQPAVELSPSSPLQQAQELQCLITTPSTDPDGDGLTYTLEWQLDGVPWVGPTTTTLQGDDTIPAAYLAAGTWTCTVTPTANSLDGPPGTDTVVVPANQRPSIGSTTITPATLRTTDDAICLPGATSDPELDTVTISFAWTVNTNPAGTNSSTLSSNEFVKDDVVECSVTPSDAFGNGTPAAASETVADSAPTAPVVAITPSSPVGGSDSLQCQIVSPSTDADLETISYAVLWLFDNSPWAGSTSTVAVPGDSIDAADVTEGDWTCIVTPTADNVDGPSHEDTVTASAPADSPPSQPTVLVSPSGSFANTADLFCEVTAESVDPDGDAVSYAVTWTVDSVAWNGANFTTVHPGDTIPGGVTTEATWECTATPTANALDGTPGTDTAEVYVERSSFNGNIVFLSSIGHNGDFGGLAGADQFCQDRADAAELPGTYMAWMSGSTFESSPVARFTWEVSTTYRMMDGVQVANDWAAMTNGTITNPITIDEFGDYHSDPGEVWSFTQIDGSNGLFGDDAYDCFGDTCTCQDWTNASPTSPNAGGVGQLQVTGSTWTEFSFGAYCDQDYRVYCFEQPSAGGLPSAPSVEVTPASPTVNADDLTCTITGASVDPENEPVSYVFDWTYNSSPWTGSTSTTTYADDTILAVDAAIGTWECTVTPYAQNTAGNPGSDSVQVSPQFPVGNLVFATSVGHNGDFGGLTGADAFCQERADAVGMPGSFKAWLSDSTGSPTTRFNQHSTPYVRVDGVQVADNWSDLTDGNIDAAINVNEYGVVGHSQFFFSFTMTNGSAGLFGNSSQSCYGGNCHCNNWTFGTNGYPPGSAVAYPGYTDDDWTDYSYINACGNAYSLMCFQQ